MAKELLPGTIELGDRVKDKITGTAGIVMVKSEWLYRCVRIGIMEETKIKGDSDNKLLMFDEEQLTIVKKQVHPSPAAQLAIADQTRSQLRLAPPTGGPRREGRGFRGKDAI